MKPLLRLVMAVVFFLGAAQVAHALLFKGTITQTITDTNDPDRHVGETYLGSYIYESPTVDGIFYTTGNPGGHYSIGDEEGYLPPAPGKLAGTMWQPHFFGPWISPDGWGYYGIGNYVGVPLNYTPWYDQVFLTIAGGVVTDFFFYLDYAGTDMRMSATGFTTTPFYDSPYAYTIITSGSVVFSDPVEMRDPRIDYPPDVEVPDASSSGSLLAFGIAASFALRRFRNELTKASRPL